MNLSKIQNRRDFLKGSFSNGLKSFFSITGIFTAQILPSANGEDCSKNISCHDCHKMGICEKEKAERTRFNVKRNGHSAKISKGAFYE
jgi:hypothetical protein